jgi:hypothetical protein
VPQGGRHRSWHKKVLLVMQKYINEGPNRRDWNGSGDRDRDSDSSHRVFTNTDKHRNIDIIHK